MRIPQNTFQGLQLDAGIIVKGVNPTTDPVLDQHIITATTGGINVVCQPMFSDLGEDVDNVPANMKELKHLNYWICSLSTNSLGTSVELIQLSLGCADVDGSDNTKIVPRASLSQGDFDDIWFVGDRADGGMVAVRLMNALSTDGFSLQTTKNGKGQISLTITGHVSINAQDVVPMEFYSAGPESGSVSLSKTEVTVAEGESVTISATASPSTATVTWTSEDTGNATVSNGTITGVSAGTATVTASVTVGGDTFTASCVVHVVEGE